MKILCDVCDKEEAIVFCSADEAALCDGCDLRVHQANKLAEKHTRFSILHPSFQHSPLCDICQERVAFLFCQEDRAILCRECDLPIHKANEHTQKHNRFLLAGIKLSPSSSSDSSHVIKTSQPSIKEPISESSEVLNPQSTIVHDHHQSSDSASVSTSSISEYLMETLPGWHVEDFLDPSPTSSGFCKTMDQALESSSTSFASEDLAMWVPQLPPSSPHNPLSLQNWSDGLIQEVCRSSR